MTASLIAGPYDFAHGLMLSAGATFQRARGLEVPRIEESDFSTLETFVARLDA